MAKLKKNILGQISGALGEVVFKQISGKNYLATRPDSFLPGSDELSIERRARFANAGKLSRSINQSNRLKSIWKPKAPAGLSAYNYIVQQNYPYVQEDTVTNNVKLIPDMGFGITVTASNITAGGLTVDISAIGTGTGINIATETTIGMSAILFLSNPIDPLQAKYTYLTLQSGNVSTSLNSALSFSAPLSNQETQLYNLYQDQKAFFVLSTLDASGKVLHYSSTVASV